MLKITLILKKALQSLEASLKYKHFKVLYNPVLYSLYKNITSLSCFLLQTEGTTPKDTCISQLHMNIL
jgi:hypothetical protein